MSRHYISTLLLKPFTYHKKTQLPQHHVVDFLAFLLFLFFEDSE